MLHEDAQLVLEREKAELAVMKEKIVESRSSEGKRKIFDKSKIPGLSPRARDNDRIVAPPKRFDDIDVPTFQNDKFRQAEEEAFRRSIEAENLRSPGFDSPLHSPAPAEAAQYATPQRGLPAAPRQPSHPEDGPRRNLFQPDREIRDEALRRERGPQVAGLAQFAADQQFGGGGGGLRVRGGGG